MWVWSFILLLIKLDYILHILFSQKFLWMRRPQPVMEATNISIWNFLYYFKMKCSGQTLIRSLPTLETWTASVFAHVLIKPYEAVRTLKKIGWDKFSVIFVHRFCLKKIAKYIVLDFFFIYGTYVFMFRDVKQLRFSQLKREK